MYKEDHDIHIIVTVSTALTGPQVEWIQDSLLIDASRFCIGVPNMELEEDQIIVRSTEQRDDIVNDLNS